MDDLLKQKNKDQASTILALIGGVESIDIGKLGDDHSLWNNTLETKPQLDHIIKDLTLLGVTFNTMISEAMNMHGEEVIQGRPDKTKEDLMLATFFTAVNSYEYFMKDSLIDFYVKNNQNETSEETEKEIEAFSDKFSLASQTHDSYWGIGFGEEGYKSTYPSFEEIRGRMCEMFDWEDFATKQRPSALYNGEFVYEIFGKEVEFAEMSNADGGKILSSKFIEFVQDKYQKDPSIKSSLSQDTDNDVPETVKIK